MTLGGHWPGNAAAQGVPPSYRIRSVQLDGEICTSSFGNTMFLTGWRFQIWVTTGNYRRSAGHVSLNWRSEGPERI